MSATLAVMEDTALVTVEKESFMTLGNPAEMTDDQLADAVIQAFAKIQDYLPYIVTLKARFDDGDRDSANHLLAPIKGCYSWKEFCGSILNRTPQALGQAMKPKAVKKAESHTVTEAEFAEYEQENQGLRKLTKKLLADGLPEADVVSALVNMEHPQEMAEAAVKVVTGVSLEEPARTPLPPNPAGLPASLQDVQLEVCSRTDPDYEAFRDKHYIPNHGCIGQQVHFLIHYKGELVGIISGASAAYATQSRDQFFGINKENRHGLLQGGVVNNNVFHLTNHEPNLATRVLRMWREVVPHIWYELYGTVVYGFETFVIENDTRKGALYKADNWTLAGTTSGATKTRNGIENPADNWKQVEPKLVFCKWRDGFTAPCSARTSDWGQQLAGEHLWASQPPLVPPAPVTWQELLTWVDEQELPAQFSDGSCVEVGRMATTQKVGLKFTDMEPATAKKVLEYYLQLMVTR